MRTLTNDLLEALEASDVNTASELFTKEMEENGNAWGIHLSLFPLVQRVQNPPFINPHWPKMYRIYREFIPYLQIDDLPGLIRLEVTEYARKPKLEKLPKRDLLTPPVSFHDIEFAIAEQDWGKTTALMAAYNAQKGGTELARQLLLLGSAFLDDSLGHSVSCTAFILLEMMERPNEDSWPALATLADYFCKGRFHTTPALKLKPFSSETLDHHLLRATSGRGIVNLHHTITRYALERVRQFFSEEEYNHMVGSWVTFLGNKTAEQIAPDIGKMEPADYGKFYESFSKLEAKSVVASLAGMTATQQGRRKLGRFLIKGMCDQYRGDYNPHYLTGLGTTLWVVDRYWNQAPIAINALFQYLDFFFTGMKSEG